MRVEGRGEGAEGGHSLCVKQWEGWNCPARLNWECCSRCSAIGRYDGRRRVIGRWNGKMLGIGRCFGTRHVIGSDFDRQLVIDHQCLMILSSHFLKYSFGTRGRYIPDTDICLWRQKEVVGGSVWGGWRRSHSLLFPVCGRSKTGLKRKPRNWSSRRAADVAHSAGRKNETVKKTGWKIS